MLTVVSSVCRDFKYHTGRKGEKMSNKTSTYFPWYQMRPEIDGKRLRQSHVYFRYRDLYFIGKIPLLGITETQKSVLQYLSGRSNPPVISISHEAPRKPDSSEGHFNDPETLYRHFYPYSVAIANVQVMGEETPRRFKVYFCNLEYHEENVTRHQHSRSKTVYIQPL